MFLHLGLACLNGRIDFILYLLLCVGQSRVQSQELLLIAPAILKCIVLGSITLWKEKKKSIFRALKAFLFFCGDRGVGKGRCMDVIGIFQCLEVFPPTPFCLAFFFFFSPLIGCTDPAQEMKRFSLLILLPMLSQNDSYL